MPLIQRPVAWLFSFVLLLSLASCSSPRPQNTSNLNPESNVVNVDVFDLANRAREAYVQSRLLEAASLYQQIIERVPNDADAWFRLGNTYAQQGSFQQAIHAYESSLSNDPDQPKAWFNLSTAYLLNAQTAMRESQARMRAGDPAIQMIDSRLQRIESLLVGRLE